MRLLHYSAVCAIVNVLQGHYCVVVLFPAVMFASVGYYIFILGDSHILLVF